MSDCYDGFEWTHEEKDEICPSCAEKDAEIEALKEERQALDNFVTELADALEASHWASQGESFRISDAPGRRPSD
jgi:hypothetical protein